MNELSWEETMQRGHAALRESEALGAELDGQLASEVDRHLRRAELRAVQAGAWFALARELATQDNRYGRT